jgi:hypothetical protein
MVREPVADHGMDAAGLLTVLSGGMALFADPATGGKAGAVAPLETWFNLGAGLVCVFAFAGAGPGRWRGRHRPSG